MRSVFVWLLPLVFAAFAAAQEELQVSQPEPGTIRLGDAARVRITIEGRTANPREFELPDVDGLQMSLSGPARSSYTSFDGRNMVQRVGVQYGLELRPTRVGTFVVPSFAIWTGTEEQRTPELRLEVRADLVGKELGFLEISVEPKRVYVHEPVRVRVDYGVQQGVRVVQEVYQRTRYLDVEVRANWLDDFPGGERIELPQTPGSIAICNGRLLYADFDANLERDGTRWQSFSFERAYLPTRLGKIELPAPMLRFHALRRSGSRSRRPMSENYYVYGEPLELEVLPIPEEGRPTPYFGAVGRFTIEASIDRGRVRVGESVKLTLVVRGEGNLEFLRMPELDELPGFHKLGENETQRDADKVSVTYDLTPLSTDVTEVPAIDWNYFDTTPGVEAFAEVRTPALPLVVDALRDGEALPTLPDEAPVAVTPGVDDIYDLPDFDGAPRRLVELEAWQRWLWPLLPWLLTAVAFVGWRGLRRRRADVTGRRARGAHRAFEQALRDGREPLEALAGYLGDRLDVPPAAVISPELRQRLVARGLDDAIAGDVVQAIERGTAQRYGGVDELPVDDVRSLVQRLESASFGARCLPLWLLPLLACAFAGGGELRAQSAAADPVALYRAGDYRAADRAFAAAFERTGDRRYLRARGNCLFRLGDLPRALWAYERARLGMPRDAELLANLRLVRQRLALPEPSQGFGAEVQALLHSLTASERAALCAALMLLAALLLAFGWRRIPARWAGGALLAPAVWILLDLVWLEPGRPLRAVALAELSLTAEPREGLDAVASVRPGVIVGLRARGEGEYVRVVVGERSGYAPRASVGIVD